MPACRAEQLYVTHCRRADSVLGQEGFGLRAASSADPALLQFALQLPAHELPSDAGSIGLTPAQAPRRLARIELPDGRVALIHSAYVCHDTRGRDDSYFTHALVYDRLKPIDALRAWAAPQWRSDYPAGASKELPCFEGVPVGGVLADSRLTAFLDSAECAGEGPRRQGWLRLLLAVCWRTLRTPEEGRTHIYVRAEPGVVALLLYGVARLLPTVLGDRLTFSTYERPGESLREQRHARVLGTWTASQKPWPDADNLQRRGYSLDLSREPIETELRNEVSPAIDRLVAVATAGDWASVEEVHALWQRRPTTGDDDFSAAVFAQPVLRRIRARPAPADVAELARHRLGRELLMEMRPSAWPLAQRLALLRGWQAVEPQVDFLPADRADLLDSASYAELAEFVGPPLPERWQGQALSRALADPRRAAEVVGLLASAAPGVASGFCAAVAHQYGANADERLAPLLPPGKRKAIARFALLQNAGLSLDPAVLERLLSGARVVEEPWLQYWLKGENLAWLGRALPSESALLRRIWTLYVRSIHQTFLLGDRKQTAFVARLQAAHQAVADRVPPEAAEVLNDWLRRRAQLCAPPKPDDNHVAVLEAAQRHGRLRWLGFLLGLMLAAGLAGAALRLALP